MQKISAKDVMAMPAKQAGLKTDTTRNQPENFKQLLQQFNAAKDDPKDQQQAVNGKTTSKKQITKTADSQEQQTSPVDEKDKEKLKDTPADLIAGAAFNTTADIQVAPTADLKKGQVQVADGTEEVAKTTGQTDQHKQQQAVVNAVNEPTAIISGDKKEQSNEVGKTPTVSGEQPQTTTASASVKPTGQQADVNKAQQSESENDKQKLVTDKAVSKEETAVQDLPAAATVKETISPTEPTIKGQTAAADKENQTLAVAGAKVQTDSTPVSDKTASPANTAGSTQAGAAAKAVSQPDNAANKVGENPDSKAANTPVTKQTTVPQTVEGSNNQGEKVSTEKNSKAGIIKLSENNGSPVAPTIVSDSTQSAPSIPQNKAEKVSEKISAPVEIQADTDITQKTVIQSTAAQATVTSPEIIKQVVVAKLTRAETQNPLTVDLRSATLTTPAPATTPTAATIGSKNLLTAAQASEITRPIVQGLKTTAAGTSKSMTLQLLPENLGKVRVSLSVTDQQVRLEFKVQSEHTKQLLESISTKLEQVLKNQDVSGNDVTSKPAAPAANGFDSLQMDLMNQQSSQRQFGQQLLKHRAKGSLYQEKMAAQKVKEAPKEEKSKSTISILA
ncbi:flagellar hook-length control protein FliK [Liquorilactobacillus capillatus]|uniref:Flagellar hook-length control protein-like C-terminal domain-containing protein n=2 Tax=Liquorilactobacillus capillatus TaxID=480931 RepID=A0A0R1M2D4_9LACO|nr:flagellar hook-length control protein FliK [Liquorilactobacillus capillatus]AJA33898.1 flagellar hook-length control protein FliK [Liquorilactobacillus capillatus]KRL02110.1 hypothetical protein FC81_GL000873 [Liquorilactobacillus capillatus DSM 19910]